MSYKSNKRARAEYLANEQLNRETNRRNYERKKAKASSGTWIIVLLLLVLALYVVNHRRTPIPGGPVASPVSQHEPR